MSQLHADVEKTRLLHGTPRQQFLAFGTSLRREIPVAAAAAAAAASAAFCAGTRHPDTPTIRSAGPGGSPPMEGLHSKPLSIAGPPTYPPQPGPQARAALPDQCRSGPPTPPRPQPALPDPRRPGPSAPAGAEAWARPPSVRVPW